MKVKVRYTRKLMDDMGFEPARMRLDVRYGGEAFEEADRELLSELARDEDLAR